MHFLFILSSVAKNEKVLTAELHLFRMRARVADGPAYKRHHFCQVRRMKACMCVCLETALDKVCSK